MNESLATLDSPPAKEPAPVILILRQAENAVLAAGLAVMALLPVTEMLLRALFQKSFFGSNAIVQHLTLLAGMVGGAIAARENRLLSLSSAAHLWKGRWKTVARVFSGTFATAIAALLALAAMQFVLTEKQDGKILAYGIPVWVVQLLIPIGFAIISWRLLWRTAEKWLGRIIVLACVAGILALGIWPPVSPAYLWLAALAGLLLATVAGAPIFVLLGGAALILFWGHDSPVASIPLDQYRLVTNPTLPAIPLFTLAGYFLAEGGASRRLVRVFQALVGSLRGGPAIVTALACAFFTCFTGASGVTILALGGLLMPVLLAARFSERTALGLLTSSGSLGLLFPPCLPLILYAIIAKVPIKEMFLGGVLPGTVLVGATILWGISRAPKSEGPRPRFNLQEAGAAIWESKWELLIPVVAIVSFLSGYATAVEAAALTALYACMVETFIYRDLRLTKDVPRVLTEAGLVVGGILLILGVALGFTNFLVDAQLPDQAVAWATENIKSPLLFLLMLNLFLLVVGCVMDIYSAIVVVVPLIVPLGLAFNIDPVHLGIIFLANLELGYLSPLVGLNVFLSSYRFKKPVSEVTRAVIPMVIVLFIGVLIITYVAPITTLLPKLLR